MDAVRALVAVQSQDYAGAKWGIGQRSASATDAELDRQFDAGTFLRTHVLRPTWHFVAPDDLRWLLALTGARVLRGTAARARFLEIDAALSARAAGVFEQAIARHGPQTRPELGQALRDAGIVADAARLSHLVMHAELDAVVCSGPRRGLAHTYALVDERVPPSQPRTREEALAELARRYVEGHGPAQAVDLAWWSGMTIGDARRGLEAAEPAVNREAIDSRTFWVASTPVDGPATGPTMHLLPNYDELLIAFQDRSDAVDGALAAPVRVAGGIFDHAVVRNGIVIGAWRAARGPAAVRVAVTSAAALDAADRAALAMALGRLSSFLGRPVEGTGPD